MLHEFNVIYMKGEVTGSRKAKEAISIVKT